jgi:putative transcriptional regulator
MIRAFEQRAGQRLTYAELAARSGVARATVESLASRPGYNATLETIDRLCDALECDLTDLVHREPTSARGADRKRKRTT